VRESAAAGSERKRRKIKSKSKIRKKIKSKRKMRSKTGAGFGRRPPLTLNLTLALNHLPNPTLNLSLSPLLLFSLPNCARSYNMPDDAPNPPLVLMVGHSNRPLQDFLPLLRAHGVTLVAVEGTRITYPAPAGERVSTRTDMQSPPGG
jgi:hypothetical protein